MIITSRKVDWVCKSLILAAIILIAGEVGGATSPKKYAKLCEKNGESCEDLLKLARDPSSAKNRTEATEYIVDLIARQVPGMLAIAPDDRPGWRKSADQSVVEIIALTENTAVMQSLDQSALESLALAGPSPLVRSIAVLGLVDLDLLGKVAQTDKDPGVRECAVGRLSGSQTWLENLVRGEQDPTVRLEIAKRLTGMPVIATIAASDPDQGVREAAIEKIDDKETLGRIILAGSGSNSAAVRTSITRRLTDQTILWTIAANTNEDPSVRAAAVERITDDFRLQTIDSKGENGVARAAVECRLSKLRTAVSGGELASAISNSDTHKVDALLAQVPRLISQLRSSDWEARASAAAALGRIRDSDAIEPLVDALKRTNVEAQPDEDIGEQLPEIAALGSFNDTRSIEALASVLSHPVLNEFLRRSAFAALSAQTDPRADELLIKAINSPNSKTRVDVTEALRVVQGDRLSDGVKSALSARLSQLNVAAEQYISAAKNRGQGGQSYRDSEDLIEALQIHGISAQVAVYLAASGNPKLVAFADEWASEHGYVITTTVYKSLQ